jgi:tyrosine phenol-lyase
MANSYDEVRRFIKKEFVKEFENLLGKEPIPGKYYRPRPFKNASVRLKKCSIEDFESRFDIAAREAELNVFRFPSREIAGCDLLSDSGTTTMTMEQWSQLLLGDEAYGSNEGYFELKAQIADTFGASFEQEDKDVPNVFLFHQGRPAERALFYTLCRQKELRSRPKSDKKLSSDIDSELRESLEYKINAHEGDDRPFHVIPSNSHFDTTEANIEEEDVNIIAVNSKCDESKDRTSGYPFKGNMNVRQLRSLLESEKERVPIIYITVTNNTGGGQPVSLENIKQVAKLAGEYKIPLFFDACRFAENAWFIKNREKGYHEKSIKSIVHEMFECVNGFHISFKKDGLVNIGGAVVIKDGGIFDKKYPDFRDHLTDHQILTEGHPTYGGLAGRDILGIVEGLKTVTEQNYLDARIIQTERFGQKLDQYGIPIIKPPGGHAIYIDVDDFFDIPDDLPGDKRDPFDFRGIAITGLLLIAGHRLCELGAYAFGKYIGDRYITPKPWVNNVRAAIPRMTYEDQDLFALAEVIRVLHEKREKIPGIKVEYGEKKKLRHFKSRFSFDISKSQKK